MNELTFLTQEQYFESEKLDILQKRGTKAAITDFSILLGGLIIGKTNTNTNYWHIDGDESLGGRTGWYWTKSDVGYNGVRAIAGDARGDRNPFNVNERVIGARPALSFSSFTLPVILIL